MKMPGRYGNQDGNYRYGFNGMESDDEMFNQEGNFYTTEFRGLDPRIGRWLSTDPVTHDHMSPYNSFDNNPIYWIDPKGSNADDYLIKANGDIDVKRTDDKTDNFKYEDAKGKVTDLGTFNKNDNGYVNIDKGGKSYSITNTKKTKRYMQPEAFAAFLGASMNYYNEYSLKIQVNQFSTTDGGHSSHGGNGQYIDYRYSNTNGDKNEPVWSQNDNFDKSKSQYMVNQLVLFGYNSTPSNLRGGKYSILTQQGFTTKPALDKTEYYTGHHHHVHLQNYDMSHVSVVKKLSFSKPDLSNSRKVAKIGITPSKYGSSGGPSIWEEIWYKTKAGFSKLSNGGWGN